MKRREFLLSTAAAATCAAGCGPEIDPRALVLRGWAYEPDLVQRLARRCEAATGVGSIDFAAVSGNYHDKMVAQFIAGNRLDLVYVRDDSFAEWVEAGWLRPVDDLGPVNEYRERMFPLNWSAINLRGRAYGLPYYTDFQTWIWNRRMLEQAGYGECATTLEGVTEQCIRIRDRRISGPAGPLKSPLSFGFRLTPIGMIDFWALMYASRAELFTPELEPLFPDDPERRAERVLQWLVDGIHRHGIIDLHASLTTLQMRDLFASGRTAMQPLNKYELQRLNDPARSQTAGETMLSRYPGLDSDHGGTIGWTRLYGIPVTSADPQKAWRVLEYFGGTAPSGQFLTAKYWYLQRGLGFAYPELFEDPEIRQATKAWGDPDEIRRQAESARPRECIQAPWFAEFDSYYQRELQEVLTAQRGPRDALARIAAECRRLRKKWST